MVLIKVSRLKMPIIRNTLVINEKMSVLNDFVKESTKEFDESHNWIHADKVYESAVKIATYENYIKVYNNTHI